VLDKDRPLIANPWHVEDKDQRQGPSENESLALVGS